jgi:hypothetical protein
MSPVQMKLVRGLFWAKALSSLKVLPIGIESGTPLTHELMDPLQKEVFGLLLEPLHCQNLSSSSYPNLQPFNAVSLYYRPRCTARTSNSSHVADVSAPYSFEYI